MVIEATYAGNLRCAATRVGSAIELLTDSPVEYGGSGEMLSPTDLVASALGTCVLTVLAIVGQRNGMDLRGMRVRIHKEMVDAPVRRIGRLSAQVMLPSGRPYSQTERRKLEAAAQKCPVKNSLHPDTTIEIQFVYPD